MSKNHFMKGSRDFHRSGKSYTEGRMIPRTALNFIQYVMDMNELEFKRRKKKLAKRGKNAHRRSNTDYRCMANGSYWQEEFARKNSHHEKNFN
jgi:hypothetical protein